MNWLTFRLISIIICIFTGSCIQAGVYRAVKLQKSEKSPDFYPSTITIFYNEWTDNASEETRVEIEKQNKALQPLKDTTHLMVDAPFIPYTVSLSNIFEISQKTPAIRGVAFNYTTQLFKQFPTNSVPSTILDGLIKNTVEKKGKKEIENVNLKLFIPPLLLKKIADDLFNCPLFASYIEYFLIKACITGKIAASDTSGNQDLLIDSFVNLPANTEFIWSKKYFATPFSPFVQYRNKMEDFSLITDKKPNYVAILNNIKSEIFPQKPLTPKEIGNKVATLAQANNKLKSSILLPFSSVNMDQPSQHERQDALYHYLTTNNKKICAGQIISYLADKPVDAKNFLKLYSALNDTEEGSMEELREDLTQPFVLVTSIDLPIVENFFKNELKYRVAQEAGQPLAENQKPQLLDIERFLQELPQETVVPPKSEEGEGSSAAATAAYEQEKEQTNSDQQPQSPTENLGKPNPDFSATQNPSSPEKQEETQEKQEETEEEKQKILTKETVSEKQPTEETIEHEELPPLEAEVMQPSWTGWMKNKLSSAWNWTARYFSWPRDKISKLAAYIKLRKRN